jgi:antirestriction protein ArdC
VNTLVLWAETQSKGYGSALWGTYQQWQSLGGQVRKGEHGSPVVYWGTYQRQTDDDQDERSHRGLFAKGYAVFNIEQVDGCKLPKRFERSSATIRDCVCGCVLLGGVSYEAKVHGF